MYLCIIISYMQSDSSSSEDEEENDERDKNTCYLLHWGGTGEVVAETIINSTDPTAIVHR